MVLYVYGDWLYRLGKLTRHVSPVSRVCTDGDRLLDRILVLRFRRDDHPVRNRSADGRACVAARLFFFGDNDDIAPAASVPSPQRSVVRMCLALECLRSSTGLHTQRA